DAAAYLRVVSHPRDDLSLRRIINFPTRGIGRTTLLRLVDAARERRVPLSEILAEARQVEGISGPQAAAVEAFDELVRRARQDLEAIEERLRGGGSQEVSLASWAESLFREIGLEGALRAESRNGRVGEIRIENLRDFVQSIASYERRTWAEAPLPDEEVEWSPPTLAGFLQGISLYLENDSAEDEDGADQVTLLTLHGAKGLEFAHVFLVGLEEEILPRSEEHTSELQS